jgi:plastocyanin
MHLTVERPTRLLASGAVAVALATLAACSSTPVSGVADGPPTDLGEIVDLRADQQITVDMVDNAYTPRAMRVVPGATVTFHNAGSQVHNATPDEDGALVPVSLGPTESADITVPTAPGTYRFFCSLHATKDGGLQRGAFVVE